ncbi:alpha/beta fold hydrolase [Phenylobacterium sp.]|uniref:alpha/beta fold hydrolase n=1 Tax=Phenylobacterium sp. TaxID=1871053 RepID=UPI0035641B3C
MLRRDIVTTAMAASAVAVTARSVHAAPVRRTAEPRAKDGIKLFHRDWGEGPPVLFAASWALSSEMWAYQVAHLADAGFRCIAYDRRGHGRSDVPASGYDMDTFADDLASVIEQLDLRDVVLVGHSSGGAEVVRYLGRHGTSRVRKVVLIAPVTPYLLKTADNPTGAPQAHFDATMAQWATDFPKWADDNTAPFVTPETSPAMTRWLYEQLVSTPPPVAIATMRAVIARDLRPDLAKIDRPTLVMHGTKDVSAPIDMTGRPTAAGIRGAELKVYDGAPHGLFVTHMDPVNRDLEAFIKA